MKKILLALCAALVIAGGILIGYYKPHFLSNLMSLKDSHSASAASEMGAMQATNASDIAYYTCSMHPSVRAKIPGNCPICSMGLIPVTVQESHSGEVVIDEGRRQHIGVKIDVVSRHELQRVIRAPAMVVIDQSRQFDITVRSAGWIETFREHASVIGQSVKKGEELFTLYSPELIAAEGDYLSSLALGQAGALREAGRARLTRLGMDESQIAQLESSRVALERIPLHSPADATVMEKTMASGARVEPGTRILRLVDLSSVWIDAAVTESELPLIAIGQHMRVSSDSSSVTEMPKREGIVSFVAPMVDEPTRTARVRVTMDNRDGTLRPGSLLTATIEIPLGSVVAVPDDAVIYSGESRIIFRDNGDGKLLPVRVTIGSHADGMTQILSGIEEGDRVVISGVFLIASESRIKSGIDAW